MQILCGEGRKYGECPLLVLPLAMFSKVKKLNPQKNYVKANELAFFRMIALLAMHIA